MAGEQEFFNILLSLFQSVLKIIQDSGKAVFLLLQIFGIPEKIIIGSYTINTPGIASIFALIIGVVLSLKFFSQYAKWIGIIAIALFVLAVIVSIL